MNDINTVMDLIDTGFNNNFEYDSLFSVIAQLFLYIFRFIFNLFVSALHLFKGEFTDLGYKAADMFDGLNGQQILCDNFIYFIVGIVVFIFTFRLVFFFVGKISPG